MDLVLVPQQQQQLQQLQQQQRSALALTLLVARLNRDSKTGRWIPAWQAGPDNYCRRSVVDIGDVHYLEPRGGAPPWADD